MSEDSIRLDKWLWYGRFCKSRSDAARFVQAGRVRINRVAVNKPAAPVKPGDVLTFPQGGGIRVVRVLQPGRRRGPPAEARSLYEEMVTSDRRVAPTASLSPPVAGMSHAGHAGME